MKVGISMSNLPSAKAQTQFQPNSSSCKEIASLIQEKRYRTSVTSNFQSRFSLKETISMILSPISSNN